MNLPNEPYRSCRSASVVGAGIAGLAATLALRRTGWWVTVHERAAALEPLGAGLVLWPNAVHALDDLGVGAAVREQAAVLDGSTLRRSDGRWLARNDDAGLATRHGAPLLGIERPNLQAILAAAVGPDVVRFGSEVRDTEALTTGHDIVVAADGIRSRLRAEGWRGHSQPAYAGYTVWRAVVGAEVVTPAVSETWGHRERFGIVPVGSGRVYIFATATVGAQQYAEDRTGELNDLRRRFGRWHDPIPALLDAVEPDAVMRHDVHALPHVPRQLHRGKTVLIGDAAHAMEPNLGQGACLALEDAVVLAHVLGDDVPVDHALPRYSAARRERVVAVSRMSAQIGRLTQNGGPVRASIRDTAVRLTPARLAQRGMDRTSSWTPPSRPTPT
ncbi:MAG: FAD-dependent monooxygenase [Intrasporangiaceae bacterium]|nr:FAD-dependent monooxygenase [Intrasporangiaceae bacterium]